ncbi:MAG: alpha/beta fold hydrolase [Gemmatimonadetes bacterium]|nr:alpha/beta fold hydrolase [Gemmatimonadota bacterium]
MGGPSEHRAGKTLSATARALLVACAVAVPSGAMAQVEWVDCPDPMPDEARCGWSGVPLDPFVGSSSTLELRVVVLPATSGRSAEPVLFFPGGPGQATTDLIPLATQVFGAARANRDYVFIGQRGSGASAPLQCVMDVAGHPDWAFGHLWVTEELLQCRGRLEAGPDPRFFTTMHYVNDIHRVLDQLGHGRVLLWGGSGGTRTAAAFIREHPDRVMGAVLDGVLPIDYTMPVPFATTLEAAWRRVVSDCAEQPDCAEAYPDLQGDLDRLASRLDSGGVQVTIERQDGASATVRMGRGDLSYAMRGVLYNPGATASLPAEIHHAAATGDLRHFAQALYDRNAVMLGGVISVGLHLASYCSEDVPRIDPASVQVETGGTLMGDYLVREYSAACQAWGVTPLDREWYRDFTSEVPVLMLSGHYDPTTPPGAAEQMRVHLPNSRHFVVRNAGHGAGFGCGRTAVTAFLTDPALDEVELECPQEPIVFEVR